MRSFCGKRGRDDGRHPEEAAACSHCPKRNHTSILNELSESKLESAHSATPERSPVSPASLTKLKPNRQSLGGPEVRGVLLGSWRDSNVPDDKKKHAVVGFIDVRDRLRTRIQPNTQKGESLAEDYPLPPGTGRRWVTFERVIFSDHLIGLDQFQVKEYTRIRSDVPPEESEEQCMAAESSAVQEAIRRVEENPALGKPIRPLAIAYGPNIPEHPQPPVRPDPKRRQVSIGFAPVNPAALSEPELPANRLHSVKAAKRISALAQREIARVEAAQGRADYHAINREQAAVAAANVATAAAAAASNILIDHHHKGNDRLLSNESEYMQRLNEVLARQDTLRMKGGPYDAKVYDGVKYERKATGPFKGKLVSQGTIINIDGEDHVEYRVLTKPSFF
ncbi:hypothetical protein MGU_09538 [Metarhizium guizhouense ARSEF 977]|uniref:Uncharacterized protein n=1 Tax=Metarhizium guizhouense (strain ARSEF 977) TaxID=1276136 RepID=A0A0B4G8Z3_METGA|nr:hypothetical protein MGU_09538 [Metarhizium guizhouense ARSEF 977]